ncbi:Os09g0298100 [Oryza sativa Japonica Group]|uniref:Os09g0298100 protein n=1 Tax=Oryza sativa subsp. japonica TaxID=39947 RepID=C7J767_ORYSJ|nr:Os09g0298100 [Oryza sativa Japonica Group]|eukprot:NP_001175755.1 Os09g0298100 [Oryza sativa Japonica Group]
MQVLGHICMHILAAGLNGYMAFATNLKEPTNKWRCAAVPLTVCFLVDCIVFINYAHLKCSSL